MRVEPRALAVGVLANIPPSAYYVDGELRGLDVDLSRSVAARMNLSVRFEEFLFPDLFPALRAGKVDMVAAQVARLPEREPELAFSDPYHTTFHVVLAAKTRRSIKKAADLARARIGVMSGNVQEIQLRQVYPEATFVSAELPEELAGLQAAGAVDAIAIALTFVDAWQLTRFRIVDVVEGPPVCLAFRGSDRGLVRAVNAVLADVRESGQLLSMLELYGLLAEP